MTIIARLLDRKGRCQCTICHCDLKEDRSIHPDAPWARWCAACAIGWHYGRRRKNWQAAAAALKPAREAFLAKLDEELEAAERYARYPHHR